jgi:tetratricopeptide (TPR) repeat protein
LQRVAEQAGEQPYSVPNYYPRTDERRQSKWHNWAITYTRFERYEEALERNGQALAIDPNHVNALICRGNILRAMGLAAVSAGREEEGMKQQEEALACYAHGLEVTPTSAILQRKVLHNMRGATLRPMRRYAEAEKEYAESLRLAHDNGSTWYNRANNARYWGEAELAAGRREEARRLFQAGLGYLEQAQRYGNNDPQIPQVRAALEQGLRQTG